MKTLSISLLAALLSGGSLHAQQLAAAQVPAAPVATFKKAFPAARRAKWEKEKDQYEVNFSLGESEMSALLTAEGKLVETETEMRPSQLPVPIRTVLATRYKAAKVTEAAKIVAHKTGAVTYEAEVSEGGKKQDLRFRADGTEVPK